MKVLLILLSLLLIAHPGGAADPEQLDQARVADMFQAKAEAAGAQQQQGQPTAKAEAEHELRTISGEIDRNGNRLIRALNGSVEPWMWWLAGALWVLLVLAGERLIRYGFARLFPTTSISWLGRIFKVFCYLICALVALYLILHGFGATMLAAPVLKVEGKLTLLAAAFGVADLALLVVNITIDRYLTRTDHSGLPIERSPRILTLLPLLRNIVMVSLGSVLALVVLGQFGVNIAPLLAGAGVVGVAVGFGAQKLVQDVITGAFMLFENTLAVGDTVKIGEHVGTVEGMTIRTLRIRDANGQLHTLPFSSVTTVVNMSRDFGCHNFELNISYGSSIDRAIEVIGETVAAMRDDPVLGADIAAPTDIYGVDRLGEWSVVLTGAIRTPPGRQFAVGRAFNRRIKEAFDRAGVEFAHPPAIVQRVRR